MSIFINDKALDSYMRLGMHEARHDEARHDEARHDEARHDEARHDEA